METAEFICQHINTPELDSLVNETYNSAERLRSEVDNHNNADLVDHVDSIQTVLLNNISPKISDLNDAAVNLQNGNRNGSPANPDEYRSFTSDGENAWNDINSDFNYLLDEMEAIVSGNHVDKSEDNDLVNLCKNLEGDVKRLGDTLGMYASLSLELDYDEYEGWWEANFS